MARGRETSGNMEITTPGERRLGWLGSFVLTVFVLLVIALVTILFAVRTVGGQTLVADRLGRRLGLDVTLERARIGWPYVLILEGVSTEDDAGSVQFEAQAIHLSWDWKARIHIKIDRGELRMLPNVHGEWTPVYFARLGDLPERDLAWLSHLTQSWRKRVCLEVNDSVIRWTDANGRQAANATGIYFEMRPVRIPHHRVSYYRLSVYSGRVAGGRVQDVEKEWLAGDTVTYLPLGPDGGGSFWSPVTRGKEAIRAQE